MSPDSSLVGMSWGSGGHKVFHPTSCPLGASHTSTARARSTSRHFPVPRFCHQKAPECAEGCVLPIVVFLPCLEKGLRCEDSTREAHTGGAGSVP